MDTAALDLLDSDYAVVHVPDNGWGPRVDHEGYPDELLMENILYARPDRRVPWYSDDYKRVRASVLIKGICQGTFHHKPGLLLRLHEHEVGSANMYWYNHWRGGHDDFSKILTDPGYMSYFWVTGPAKISPFSFFKYMLDVREIEIEKAYRPLRRVVNWSTLKSTPDWETARTFNEQFYAFLDALRTKHDVKKYKALTDLMTSAFKTREQFNHFMTYAYRAATRSFDAPQIDEELMLKSMYAELLIETAYDIVGIYIVGEDKVSDGIELQKFCQQKGMNLPICTMQMSARELNVLLPPKE